MSNNWTSWGKQPNQTMRHQGDRDECPYCGYDDQLLFMLNAYIVGFSTQVDHETNCYDPDNPCVGIVVKECPHCFEHCVCHIYRQGAERLARKALTKPDFFKVPSAQKTFLKMLKGLKNGRT